MYACLFYGRTIFYFGLIAEDQRTTEEILDEAKKIQKESHESTTRSKKIVQEITETGNATLEQLQSDRAKLEDVHNDLEEMDSDLRMAQNQLKGIARKLSRDNLIRYEHYWIGGFLFLRTIHCCLLFFHFEGLFISKFLPLFSLFFSASFPPFFSLLIDSGLCIIACLIILVAIIVVIIKRDVAGGGSDST